jgi:hypothetical protein
MGRPLKQYAYWDTDGQYWETYNKKEDAVRGSLNQKFTPEIFEVRYKALGFFKLKETIVKAKKPAPPKRKRIKATP